MLVTVSGNVNVPDSLVQPLNAFAATAVTVYCMASSPSPTMNDQGIFEASMDVDVAMHADEPLPSAAVRCVIFVLTVHVTPWIWIVPTSAFAANGIAALAATAARVNSLLAFILFFLFVVAHSGG